MAVSDNFMRNVRPNKSVPSTGIWTTTWVHIVSDGPVARAEVTYKGLPEWYDPRTGTAFVSNSTVQALDVWKKEVEPLGHRGWSYVFQSQAGSNQTAFVVGGNACDTVNYHFRATTRVQPNTQNVENTYVEDNYFRNFQINQTTGDLTREVGSEVTSGVYDPSKSASTTNISFHTPWTDGEVNSLLNSWLALPESVYAANNGTTPASSVPLSHNPADIHKLVFSFVESSDYYGLGTSQVTGRSRAIMGASTIASSSFGISENFNFAEARQHSLSRQDSQTLDNRSVLDGAVINMQVLDRPMVAETMPALWHNHYNSGSGSIVLSNPIPPNKRFRDEVGAFGIDYDMSDYPASVYANGLTRLAGGHTSTIDPLFHTCVLYNASIVSKCGEIRMTINYDKQVYGQSEFFFPQLESSTSHSKAVNFTLTDGKWISETIDDAWFNKTPPDNSGKTYSIVLTGSVTEVKDSAGNWSDISKRTSILAKTDLCDDNCIFVLQRERKGSVWGHMQNVLTGQFDKFQYYRTETTTANYQFVNRPLSSLPAQSSLITNGPNNSYPTYPGASETCPEGPIARAFSMVASAASTYDEVTGNLEITVTTDAINAYGEAAKFVPSGLEAPNRDQNSQHKQTLGLQSDYTEIRSLVARQFNNSKGVLNVTQTQQTHTMNAATGTLSHRNTMKSKNRYTSRNTTGSPGSTISVTLKRDPQNPDRYIHVSPVTIPEAQTAKANYPWKLSVQ